MSLKTLTLYSVGSVDVFRADTAASLNGDNPITQAVNGNAFSWKNPSDVAMIFGTSNAALTLDSADGVVRASPVSGSTVTDQRLAVSATVDGVTYNPNSTTILWQSPAPVYVRAEYSVPLQDALGNTYTMVGISVVSGYNPVVVGVTFVGATPPPGTTLYYRQGQSGFDDTNPEVPLTVLCFAGGTMILSDGKEIAADQLQVGMQVMTRDHGLQPIRWIARRHLSAFDLASAPQLRPVRIAAGALGAGLPRRDVVVSPQHRVLLRSKIAMRIFGVDEILVPAIKLLDVVGVSIARDLNDITYVHFLCDAHQIVFAEGLQAETLFTGPQALKLIPAAARRELMALFPDMAKAEPARMLVSGRDANRLIARHMRHAKPLVA